MVEYIVCANESIRNHNFFVRETLRPAAFKEISQALDLSLTYQDAVSYDTVMFAGESGYYCYFPHEKRLMLGDAGDVSTATVVRDVRTKLRAAKTGRCLLIIEEDLESHILAVPKQQKRKAS